MDDFQYQQPQHFRITNKQREEEKKRKTGSCGGIPDRWLDYLGVNLWIENTRFIAFKCPLKPEMQKHLTDERRFTLGDIVEKLDDQGKELGLIIDLTNTDRYYKAADIADAQIQYHKMMTPGHNQIPSEACYQQFVNVVRTFLEENKNNDKLIGVHCTHGLNRTGYLIVRYMIEQLDFEPNEALEAFNRARGHSMEKYTEDLLKRKPLSKTTQSTTSLLTSASSLVLTNNNTTTVNNNNNNNDNSSANGDQIQWPTLYSTIESMSLNGRYIQKQQKSQPIPSSISMQDYKNPVEQQQIRSTSSASMRHGNDLLKSRGHGRTNNSQQNATNNHFYRQTSVTPRILNSSHRENQTSIQSSSTYYGSGSNVGRGRPMTGDR
ncbi:unnamed protein product [Rotaria socialis]|uniref:Tyrosine specific protein phosphatases domain-containing protein n=1 Tax=Rotaria socialis TaxID=392032 RepID=A0A817T9U9_9BILA|nr:unnamed protein product [Rotaria socialis]CAF3357852.1 unnamed protein product [Rotaria socialis]CAF3521836.1 unnamed protein product [Rotaria socialis]CAF4489156.1 unnamed protein product [Rotaria socialis]CAF4502426.1 unnamed protein product [Rotaria socialis]